MNMFATDASGGKKTFECMRCGHVETRTEEIIKAKGK
jgi:transcription elongation factor Elf1